MTADGVIPSPQARQRAVHRHAQVPPSLADRVSALADDMDAEAALALPTLTGSARAQVLREWAWRLREAIAKEVAG